MASNSRLPRTVQPYAFNHLKTGDFPSSPVAHLDLSLRREALFGLGTKDGVRGGKGLGDDADKIISGDELGVLLVVVDALHQEAATRFTDHAVGDATTVTLHVNDGHAFLDVFVIDFLDDHRGV